MLELINKEDRENGESFRTQTNSLKGFLFYTLGKVIWLIWTFVLTTLKVTLIPMFLIFRRWLENQTIQMVLGLLVEKYRSSKILLNWFITYCSYQGMLGTVLPFVLVTKHWGHRGLVKHNFIKTLTEKILLHVKYIWNRTARSRRPVLHVLTHCGVVAMRIPTPQGPLHRWRHRFFIC